MRSFRWVMAIAALVAGQLAVIALPARADMLSYYVGIDNLQTFTSGAYNGLPNPNYNHLTLLYAHWNTVNPASNHYHSKGALVYTGPNLGVGNTAIIRSASNYVPEGANPPIKLSPGSGIYSGKLITNPYTNPSDPVYGFSFLTHGSTDSLDVFAPGTGEEIMHNSSSGRWNGPAAPAHLHAEIVSLTPGLNVGDASTLSIGGVGTEVHLTNPGDLLDFTPVLWTDANAAPGIYEAVFRFFDEDGSFGDSGNIRYRVQVVPEPSTLAMVGFTGIGSLLAWRRKRRFQASAAEGRQVSSAVNG